MSPHRAPSTGRREGAGRRAVHTQPPGQLLHTTVTVAIRSRETRTLSTFGLVI